MFSQFDRFTREPDLAKRRTIAGEIGTITLGEGLVDLTNADLYRSPEITAL
ncbi:hypothetical protein [Methylobacterium sp. WL18]|uniref:hypothetical protein n=1 Tax=Methylobacterium sp. WL18 TaxID=2603897 RepID=UPI00164F45E4|nr:hypothetical protein [Methylobacterium sp. WL18]